MNLIPEKIISTGNYYCTWATQARLRPADMIDDSTDVRNNMREDVLFGEDGILSSYMKEIRGDLIVLLDDGWDVPYGTKNPDDTGKFGSMKLDEGRFPSFTGTPAERLSKLVERIKSLGYKGVGLWVACQKPFKNGDPPEDIEESRKHWEDAAKMCHEAGVCYWKVDWGRMAGNADYRAMMTECVREYAPGLEIEHFPSGMYPPFGKYVYGRDHFTDSELLWNSKISEVSDYLRTYDVHNFFANSITLNRVALLLESRGEKSSAKLNVEDSAYLGAGLGCAIGIMRHQKFEKGRESKSTIRYTETVRAVKWQRISPPFAVGETDFRISGELLTDFHTFPPKNPDTWPFVAGKTLVLKSPAAVSRGCELPEASGESKPLLAASMNPQTCAYSIAALERTVGDDILESLRADVTADAKNAGIFGIFGKYRSLTLTLEYSPAGKRILAQDLSKDEAADVTDKVTINENKLIIPGTLIDEICRENLIPGDDSAPGIAIRIKD